jgi:hypothetical protein
VTAPPQTLKAPVKDEPHGSARNGFEPRAQLTAAALRSWLLGSGLAVDQGGRLVLTAEGEFAVAALVQLD